MIAALPIAHFLLTTTGYSADLVSPFRTSNQNPFIQIFALPSMKQVSLIPAGSWLQHTTLHAASNASIEETDSESVSLSGESYRLDLAWHYGWRDRLGFSLSIPVIYHGDANFVSAIKKWHQAWGLSNTQRDNLQSSELNYRYSSTTDFQLNDPGGGIGDVRVATTIKLMPTWRYDANYLLTAALKLPTGNVSKLTGSGNYDFSLLISINEISWPHDALSSYVGFGIGWLGQAKSTLPEHHSRVFTISAGTGLHILNNLTAKAQLDFHSTIYDVDVPTLNKNSTQITVGGVYQMQSGLLFEAGLTENLYTDATPDVVVYFSLSQRYF